MNPNPKLTVEVEPYSTSAVLLRFRKKLGLELIKIKGKGICTDGEVTPLVLLMLF